MPRFSRKSIGTSFLHVMTQGINKSYIFEKTEDIKFYIKIMYELKKEYNLNIIAYCIMNNHVHILVEVDNISSLSKYMQRLNTRYGKYYNKKYNRVGFVFRNRFRSEGIYNENHLLNCIKYIYENPVKAGICKHASEYPYSNYKETNTEISDNYFFIDTDEEQEQNRKYEIKKFLLKNNIELDDLKKDMQKSKEIIQILKNTYNMSFRAISRELNINRDKISNIYNS